MICGSAAELLYAVKGLIKSNFHQIHFNIRGINCLPIFYVFFNNFCVFSRPWKNLKRSPIFWVFLFGKWKGSNEQYRTMRPLSGGTAHLQEHKSRFT